LYAGGLPRLFYQEERKAMTFTDLVIILFILALLAYAIYDQFIMPRRNGPVLLAIPCFAAAALTA
jgi:hypothetical protein